MTWTPCELLEFALGCVCGVGVQDEEGGEGGEGVRERGAGLVLDLPEVCN